MDLRVMTEPQQGATYDALLAVARTAEDCGYDAFFRSDHLLYIGPDGEGVGGLERRPPGGSDAWTTLAGLARDTTRIRLGTLVSSATFRHPALLALQVAGVDAMSGGRVELGLGAGWYAREHEALGVPFPEVRERFDRLEEQLAVITGLWQTPAELAARYAAEYNTVSKAPQVMAAQNRLVQEACRAQGRDPATLLFSTYQTLCCGLRPADLERRAAAVGSSVEELRSGGHLVGSPAEVVDQLGAYAAAGAQRVYLELGDLADLDHLELVAAQVRPQLG